jgi:fluoride exporter
MEKTWIYVCVGGGSALGGMGRFWLSGLIARRVGETFPWGTLAVNISGSLVIGFLAAMIGPESRLNPKLNPFILQFLMIGICGGYTTFSSFSLQTLNLLRDGQWLHAGVNAVFSLVFCLVAVWVGHSIGQLVNR